MSGIKNELIERLTRYVKVDTQSDENNPECPSTPGQWTLLRMLEDELKQIGMQDVFVDENGYLMATLPSNTDKQADTIGFLSHVDTALDMTGKNVKPQLVVNYAGGDIVLSSALKVTLSPREYPELTDYVGHTLITTDGTTLLGADNKAGISEIMTAMAYLIRHPEIKHGKVRIAFTPDEEIGRGAHKFDVERFGASYAYTVDGGPLGELEYESFNAAQAIVTIKGNSVHPGSAKGKMIHSAKIAMALHDRLPAGEAPEFTEGYEGFFHLNAMEGDVETSTLRYIIRDFDRERFEGRKALLEGIVEEFGQTYGADNVTVTIKDQYYNMREKIEPVFHIVEIAQQAMENLDIKPVIRAIRGGTDGSQLSYMGLPTPNIFTGGENYHGKFEYVSVDNMVKATNVIVEIIKLYEQKASQE